ncbi:uncharacterized protein DNG_05841 [Cephalotrichum gorgonifer]|uniref:F-box domain-containing protein n=1 Tax=Cephalotrichum gorgonifer TaxID=2041049 RepID=A0AAE8N0K6_9PEZI|nr:uncharacterized protein DNG_05841 [Cephalotrichum gorgonifer]
MGQAASFTGAAPEARISLTSLPPELLLSTTKHCDARDVVSFSRTCRYAAAVCDDVGAIMNVFFNSGVSVDEHHGRKLAKQVAERGPVEAKRTWNYMARVALTLPCLKRSLCSGRDIGPAISVLAALTNVDILDKETTKAMAGAVCWLLTEAPSGDASAGQDKLLARTVLADRFLFCLAVGMLRPDARPDEWTLELPAALPVIPIGETDGFHSAATHLLCIVLTLHSLSAHASRLDIQPGDLSLQPDWLPSAEKMGLADGAVPLPLPSASYPPDDPRDPHPVAGALARSAMSWYGWYGARSAELAAPLWRPAGLFRGAWRGVIAYYSRAGTRPECSFLYSVSFEAGGLRWVDGQGVGGRFGVEMARGKDGMPALKVVDDGGEQIMGLFVTPLGLAGGAGPGDGEGREFYWFFREEWCAGGWEEEVGVD